MRKSGHSRGFAMLLVIVAFALIIALGTAALVAANAALATSTDGITQKQAYYSALSISRTYGDSLIAGGNEISEAANSMANGTTQVINADAGEYGTAEITVSREASTLTVCVNAVFNEESCKVTSTYKLDAGAWSLLSYKPY